MRNPEATPLPSAVRRALSAAISRVRAEYPDDEDHYRALQAACPEISEDARERVVNWRLDEEPNHLPGLDVLLEELHTLHKLLRITHAEV